MIQIRVAEPSEIYCSAVLMGSPAPSSSEVMSGSTASGVPGPSVFLQDDFRAAPTSAALNATEAFTTYFISLWVPTVNSPDVDVYCVAVETQNAVGVLSSKATVRFLSRTHCLKYIACSKVAIYLFHPQIKECMALK